MKPTRNLPLLVLTFLALATSTFAQSPREQFQTAVAAYQKSGTEENALKLAELYKQLDPPPAIPADAEYHAQKGAAFAELAKEPADFQRAVAEFQQAIQLAPWVGEYHYNTALMLKSKGGTSDLEAAMRAIKLARLLAKDDKEKRDATALSAKLEVALEVTKERAVKQAAEEKAAAAKAAADTPQARETALLQKVEGATFVLDLMGNPHTPTSPYVSYEDIFEIKDGTLFQSLRIYSMGSGNTRALEVNGHDKPGLYSIAKASYRDGAFTITTGGKAQVYRIRPDGQALSTEGGIYMQGHVKVIPRQ